jgi:predicted TIM-barrel fold metal-dependent hydrolase
MIIDSHVYCFTPVDQPGGYASAAERMRWVQMATAGHQQHAFRIRDRRPSDSKVLAPLGKDLHGPLPDLNFRVDHDQGRTIWTIDGEDHTKYWFPPNLRNVEYTPHSLISEMDYAGVDVALLHTDPALGRDSAYLADCCKQYPERIYSMAPVDQWRIVNEPAAVIEELTTAINTHGLHAIKIIPPLGYLSSDEPWDDGPYRAFWEAATSLNVPVFFTLGWDSKKSDYTTESSGLEGYLQQLRILMRWMDRYPNTVCSLTHGFPWFELMQGDRIVLPDEIWEPFKNPNCNLEVCMPVRLGDLYDYPYRGCWPAMEAMLEHIGAGQLLWGTDMPFQNRFCTYRQSRDWIEKYCTFITEQDMALLMGGTCARILGIPTS